MPRLSLSGVVAFPRACIISDFTFNCGIPVSADNWRSFRKKQFYESNFALQREVFESRPSSAL
jgi:hypothetical protein